MFAGVDESTCQEGVNCDTYTLTVGGTTSDWQAANKAIRIAIDWQVPANDYDLFIHKDSNAGPVVASSANGAPETEEAAVISPATMGTGVYTVHVVYFLGTSGADQYRGSATVVPAPSAVYLKGGFTFSTPRTASAPATVSDGEPSSRCDKFGNYYVAGIRGVPGGCDLWYYNLNRSSSLFDPNLRNPIYRGMPDGITGSTTTQAGGDGGGDVDLAVGFPPTGTPVLSFVSLTIGNISAAISSDMGQSWQKNPLGNVTGGAAVDDRQWIQFYGDHVVYLLYRTFQPAVTQIQQSTDGGFTWGPARTAGEIGQVGSVDVDQNDGTVYVVGSSGQVAVGVPDLITQEPLTYNVYPVLTGSDANLFSIIRVGSDGTVYLCFSDGQQIYLTFSTNKGATWSSPVRVSDGPDTKTALFPALVVGTKPGTVDIAWYGSSDTTNEDQADWKVFFAQGINANTSLPTFTQSVVTPYAIHGSNISLGGTLGNANRNLLDYFQITLDPQGQAVIAYTDDHNDYNGNVYVAHQIGGHTTSGGKVNGHPQEGSGLPPASSPTTSAPQVTDPAQDVTDAALGVIPANDPLDILAVSYWNTTTPVDRIVWTQMKVSDLSVIPPLSNWMMNFTFNAPGVTSSLPAGGFSYGNSDRGDQFYVEATTDQGANVTYTWGTAVRNSDGSISYTSRGAADSGTIDPRSGMITLGIAASRLAPFCTHGPAPQHGSIVCGLRGRTFTSGPVIARSDHTRGGTQFTIN